ncbi:MAG TPA: OmpA family protein [Flavobacteriales bacterium]|nr:OmpA family protein [Flavobacteriales bacterium]
MKTTKKVAGIIGLLAFATTINAQNLVRNGSFEETEKKGFFECKWKYPATGVTSANNTTIDFFDRDNKGKDYDVPENWLGSQNTASGNGDSYAGIIAFYGDEWGLLETYPGYQQYSEYLQMELESPLEAGKSYTISFRNSLAEESAYAVSGLGVYISQEKADIKDNSFMAITPHLVTAAVSKNTDWETVSGTYIAKGGEKYLILGCFKDYMVIDKVIPENTNNSRKAYYYIDDIAMTPTPPTVKPEDFVTILYGTCAKLEELNFELDKAVILPESYDELTRLSDFLKTYPFLSIYIDGHTDKTGTDDYNQKLSEERAMAVKAFLTDHGVDAARLKTRGFGSTKPIDTANENSMINRRVEVTACE